MASMQAVVTGKSSAYSRSMLVAEAQRAGLTLMDAVSASTSVVFAAGYPTNARRTTKLLAAQSLGIPLFPITDLEAILRNGLSSEASAGNRAAQLLSGAQSPPAADVKASAKANGIPLSTLFPQPAAKRRAHF